MKIFSKKSESNLSIFLTYNLVTIISSLVFYPLFPLLLNYPPGSINTKFDVEFSYIPYYQQYIIINLLIMTIGYLCFKWAFNGADKWKFINQSLNSKKINEIKRIRKKSFIIPHLVYILQILLPTIFVGILFVILGFHNTADLKFFLVLTTFLNLAAVISYLFSKKYFRTVLKHTYIENSDEGIIRISLRKKIILQILPLFLLSVMYLLLLGQSVMVKEKGNVLFKSYQRELLNIFIRNTFIENEGKIKHLLKTIKTDNNDDISFYITPSGEYHTRDNSYLSSFFLKYTKELAFKYNGHTYDYYGSDIQGAVIKLPGIGGEWIFGIKYIVVSPESTIIFIVTFIVLLLVAIFVLSYFAKTISDDITLIATSLTEIAEGEDIHLNKKIAVTSNDEIGDLVIAFNKVQDREQKHIQNIKEQQRIIMERERLVSLGQMMGGITHNLKSPAILIAGFLERMTVLEKQLEELLANENNPKENYFKIAKKMKNELDEVKPYSAYISSLLTTARDRAVQLNAPDNQSFSIAELQNEIKSLLSYELKKYHCQLKLDLQLDPQLIIKGEINNLIQVIRNIILNAIQAYKGKNGIIEFIIDKYQDNKIRFIIRDYAGGIPEEIQTKLFKEMITTKDHDGSGLGLYMSHLTIKGRFGGELSFQSTEGIGTTFYIIIPYHQEDVDKDVSSISQ